MTDKLSHPCGRTDSPRHFAGLSLRHMLPALLVACLALFGPAPARAVAADATQAPASASLNADQAHQLITMLSDDTKRQQFLTTLQNLTRAEQDTVHVSIIDQARTTLSAFGDRALKQMHILHQNVIDFGAIGPWVHKLFRNAALQGSIMQIILRVIVMLVASYLLFYGVRFLFRPLHQRISDMAREHDRKVFQREAEKLHRARAEAEKARAAAEAATPPAGTGHDVAADAAQNAIPGVNNSKDDSKTTSAGQDKQAEQQADASSAQANAEDSLRHQGALTQLMLCLRRAPYTLASALLELVGIVMFPLVALLIEVLDPAATPQSTHAVWGIAWLVGVALGLWTVLLRMFLAPQTPWLRLSILRDRSAAFIFRYFRRIGVIMGGGFALLEVLHEMTIPAPVSHGLQKLLMLVVHLILAVMIVRSRGMIWRACQHVGSTNRRLQSVMMIVARAWWVVALFFDFALWLVWAADISGGYQLILQLFVRTVVALVIVRTISILVYGGLERFMRALDGWNLNADTLTRIRRYYPAATMVIRVLMAVLTIIALALAWGAPVYSLVGHNTLGAHIVQAIVTVLVALIIGVIAWELANVTIEHHIRRLGEQDSRETKARVARLQTLTPMFRILFLLVLAVIIGLTVLSQLGIDTAPLIASASIFGVALGFGSQKLVQDFISGIFLLLENALTVGDSVTLNGTYGVVERLSLRSVHVRANDGSMNIFSFSSLSQVTNYNREFSRAMIISTVDIDTDTDKVVEIFDVVAKELRVDPAFKDFIIADFSLWGVSAIGESSVTVRGVYPTTTGGRWPVEWEFNRRVKKRFEEAGIQYPRDVVDIQGPALEKFLGNSASDATGQQAGK